MTYAGTIRAAFCRKHHAFTLIELLVVISVISLLVAILLPALASARTAAQVSQALVNARQVTFCLFTYSEDYRGCMPHARFLTAAQIAAGTPTTSPLGVGWGNKLLSGKYLNTAKAFWAPTRDASRVNFTAFPNNPDHPDLLNTGLGLNSATVGPLQNFPLSNTSPLRVGLASNPQPSQHLALMEIWRSNQYPWPLTPGIDGWYAAGYSNANNRAFTINDMNVRSFMDGRAINSDSHDIGWVPTGFRTGSWMNSSTFDYTGKPWFN